MNTAPDAGPKSVDDELRRLRALVFGQDVTVAACATQLHAQLARYSNRVRLLEQLGSSKAPGATSEMVRLSAALEEWATGDLDVALEVATALLSASAETPILDRILVVLHDRSAANHSSTPTAVRFLLMSGRAAQASRLLRAILPDAVETLSTLAIPSFASPVPPVTAGGNTAGLLSGVVALCTQLIESDPFDDETRRVLAWSLLELGKYEDLLIQLNVLVVTHPEDEELTRFRVAALEGLGRSSEALSALEPLRVNAPDDLALTSLRLRLMLKSGLVEQALNLAETSLDLHRDDVGLTLSYIEALERIKGSESALTAAREAHRRQPQSPRLAVVVGGLMVKTARFDKAIPLLENSVSRGDGGPHAARLLAVALVATDRRAEALKHLDDALRAYPQHPMLLLQRAVTLHALGRLVEALDAVEAAERVGTGEPNLWALRADVLLALGRASEAVPQYARALATGSDEFTASLTQRIENSALDLSSDRPDAALVLMVAVKDAGRISPYGRGLYAELLRVDGRLEEAVSEADIAREAGADFGWMINTKAQALVDLSRADQALRVLDEIGADPENLFGVSARIDALLALDRISEADRLLGFHFAIKDRPEPGDEQDEWLTWKVQVRGQILFNLGHFLDAGAVMRRYTKAYGRRVEWDWWLAVSYSQRHEFNRALPLLRLVAEEMGDNETPAWNELGDTISRDGQLSQEARSAYERSLRITPIRPWFLLTQAWARFRLGDIQGAIEGYQRLLNSVGDPRREDRFRFALALYASGDETAGLALIKRVLSSLPNVPEFAAPFIAQGLFTLDLFDNDPRYGSSFEQARYHIRDVLNKHQQRPLTAT